MIDQNTPMSAEDRAHWDTLPPSQRPANYWVRPERPQRTVWVLSMFCLVVLLGGAVVAWTYVPTNKPMPVVSHPRLYISTITNMIPSVAQYGQYDSSMSVEASQLPAGSAVTLNVPAPAGAKVIQQPDLAVGESGLGCVRDAARSGWVCELKVPTRNWDVTWNLHVTTTFTNPHSAHAQGRWTVTAPTVVGCTDADVASTPWCRTTPGFPPPGPASS